MARKSPAKGPFPNGHGLVPGATLYQKVREAISVKQFDGDQWPTAVIDQEGVKAVAIVQPDPDGVARMKAPAQEQARTRMWELVKGMDDLTADVLDAVACLWIQQAGSQDEMVWMTADQFLAFRGLRPHRNSEGRASGYKDEQRRRVAEHLERLEATWIDVLELEVIEEYQTSEGKTRRRRRKWKGRSRALVRSSEFGQTTATGELDPYAWKVRPGDVFAQFLLGPGRDVVLLSRKALEYDPYRQDIEKRLARFFAYQWRLGPSGEPPQFTVTGLLEAAHKAVSPKHPSLTKQRLERALLTLACDQVITIPGLVEAAAAHYDGNAEQALQHLPLLVQSETLLMDDYLYPDGRRDLQIRNSKWWQEWLTRPVLISPPPVLANLYREIAATVRFEELPAPERVRETPAKRSKRRDLVAELKQVREEQGLSLSATAVEIGVSRGYMSLIESRARPLSMQMTQRLQAWLDERRQV